MMLTLEVKNLSYGYSDSQTIFENISLTIDKPGLYCILGPNGVGKSTFVKCLNRILSPKEGSVVIDGRDTKEMNRSEISELISYVPPSSEDVFSMPVVDAIRVGTFNNRRKYGSAQSLKNTYKVMDLLHIRNLADKGFKELSAGQHQKVLLARGLVQDSPIVLLDEPTSNLDLKFQVFIMELMRGLAISDNKIIIMISHDINLASKYAHEVLMFASPGKLFKRGTPEETIIMENLRVLYGIDCNIIQVEGHPYIVPGHAELDDEE